MISIPRFGKTMLSIRLVGILLHNTSEKLFDTIKLRSVSGLNVGQLSLYNYIQKATRSIM